MSFWEAPLISLATLCWSACRHTWHYCLALPCSTEAFSSPMQLIFFNQKYVNQVLSIADVSCISSKASLQEQQFCCSNATAGSRGVRQGEDITGSELLHGQMNKGTSINFHLHVLQCPVPVLLKHSEINNIAANLPAQTSAGWHNPVCWGPGPVINWSVGKHREMIGLPVTKMALTEIKSAQTTNRAQFIEIWIMGKA